MQISAVMYPSINAKLDGMYAQKIKRENLEELIKQNTTKQAIALLKSLNEDFKNLEDNPRRIKIKRLLDDILIKDIKKIYRLLSKEDKKILLYFISIYEVKCIKSVFRKLSSSSRINEQTNEIENWTNKIFKNLIGIENVKDYKEFLRILKKTSYYSVFANHGEDMNHINIFEIENKLDKLYFENIMNVAKKYNNHLEDMIGKQIDLNNIIWIYRIKKHYSFSDDEIKNILINKNYLLKKSEVSKLILANNEKEMKEILNSTYYSKYIDFNELIDLEEKIDRYLYRCIQKIF